MKTTRIAGSALLLVVVAMFIACGGAGVDSKPAARSKQARTGSTVSPATAAKSEQRERTTQDWLALLNPPVRRHAEHLIAHGRPKQLDLNHLEIGEVGQLDEPVEVFQVIDQRNFLAEIGSSHVWMEVGNTAGLVDGQRIRLRDVLHVVGTKQYVTAFGAPRTVYHMEAIETGLAEEIAERELDREREVNRQREKAAAEKRRQALMHDFVDNTGEFRIRGIFKSMQDGQVTIEKEDGTEIDVPTSRLSGEDLHFIREFAKQQRKKGDPNAPGRGVADKAGLRPGL